MVGHEDDVYSLDFSLSGRTIASGSFDRTIRLWNIDNGRNTLTLPTEYGINTVAISPDGSLVAAGSLGYAVYIWNIHTGIMVERLEGPEGHKDSVYTLAFAPNSRNLVSGSLDRTIKMWELSSSGEGKTRKQGRCLKTFEGHKVSLCLFGVHSNS